MNIGLVDVDGHNFPNFALMRLSACYKAKGHRVEWAALRQRYDKVLASKVFTFTPDYDYDLLDVGEVVRGGPAREAARRGRKDYGRGTGLAPEQAQDEAEHPYRMGPAAA